MGSNGTRGDCVLGAFPSRIVTVLSPGQRATLSLSPGATVSHVHRTSRIWDSSRRTARTAPGKGEAKSLSGKFLCYLKLSKTPLTKCYFGMNTCCQLTPGTATPIPPPPRRIAAFPQRWIPSTRLKSSKRRQNHRHNLPATPICPAATPALVFGGQNQRVCHPGVLAPNPPVGTPGTSPRWLEVPSPQI